MKRRVLLAAVLTFAIAAPANGQVFGGVVHDPLLQASTTAQAVDQIGKTLTLVQQGVSVLQAAKSFGSPAGFSAAISQATGLLTSARAQLATSACPVSTGGSTGGGLVATNNGGGVSAITAGGSSAPAAASTCQLAANVASQQVTALNGVLSALTSLQSLSRGGVSGPTAGIQLLTEATQQATSVQAQLLQLHQAEVIQQAAEKQAELQEFLAPASL